MRFGTCQKGEYENWSGVGCHVNRSEVGKSLASSRQIRKVISIGAISMGASTKSLDHYLPAIRKGMLVACLGDLESGLSGLPLLLP